MRSCDIMGHRLRVATRRLTAGRIDVEPKLDIARYHMIELQIILIMMSFSALAMFLARLVERLKLTCPWPSLLACVFLIFTGSGHPWACLLSQLRRSLRVQPGSLCCYLLEEKYLGVSPTSENQFHCTTLCCLP